ncbi:MAG TPA: hypothetical protein VLA52_17045 [Thermohalobaculum sp.]|nr:hypothetical protein [Thermohalobaculum sp.]
MIHRFLPALAASLLLAACQTTPQIGPLGGGSRYDVEAIQVALRLDSDQRVSVTVIDDRPYVVSGKESEQFLGTEQGAWAQTKDIKTKSGNGLAEDLTGAIVNALADTGIAATASPMRRGTPAEDSLAAFQAQGTDRLLEVRIQDWRVDSYTRVYLQWRLQAAVYDRSGAMLGRSSTSGKAPVGGTTASEDGNAITGRELSQKLTNLLNEPRITDALKGG